jgi:FHS family L-fucose permease-like MFS transporter
MTQSKQALVKREYLIPFILVTLLFFLWGFSRSILDVLNKHFQEALNISMTQSAKVQASTYIAYFLMALPAGMFITRFGYRKGVVTGLLLFAIGAFCFIPGEAIGSFNIFLAALFIVGCGLVFLETSANPYITELGDSSTGASRLNLAQSFNGLGCIFAPAIVAPLIFPETGEANISLPYGVMAVVVLLIAFIFCKVKLPEIKENSEESSNEPILTTIKALLTTRRFIVGVLALFCYEIAEISINSFFINYTTYDGWMSPSQAAVLLSFGGLMLFMLARVLGSWIMSRIAAEKVLMVCAIATVVCSLLVTLNLGICSKVALFACYAFEAIMFPTIFAISIKGLGKRTKIASSFLMMTPLGGAVGSLLMGVVADNFSISTAFIVPCLGYAVVLIYTLFASRIKG